MQAHNSRSYRFDHIDTYKYMQLRHLHKNSKATLKKRTGTGAIIRHLHKKKQSNAQKKDRHRRHELHKAKEMHCTRPSLLSFA